MIRKLRTQQIIMDLPKEESDVFIRATLQLAIKNEDYKTIQLIDRHDVVHRELSRTMFETVTVVDPINGVPITLNGATIATALTRAIMNWILEEHPDYRENDKGDIIKEN
jgi:hypothetical protein